MICKRIKTLPPGYRGFSLLPEARGQSVGTSLISHALTYVQGLGHEKLYLLTEHRQLFFSQIGFEEIDKTSLNDFPLSIMVLNLKEKLPSV